MTVGRATTDPPTTLEGAQVSATSIDQRARAQSQVRRELLVGLIRKDLKVKYQGSVLGFLWSLANPLLLLVVYSFVFGVVLKNGIPQFGFYLLSGLLVWNMFSGSVSTATESVVGNSGLVKKVRFPLGILPMTAVGFNLVHFVLQLFVLLVVMLATGFTSVLGAGLLLLIPALAVALIFTVGLAYLVAGLNVRYRDTKHIVEVVLMAGFWVNPIVYSIAQVTKELNRHGLANAYYLNPMAGVTTAMQRALYAKDVVLANGDHVLADPGYLFYFERLGVGAVISLFFLWLGTSTYRRLSADFAEEL
jgi:ABC-2 type transport system permease protein